MVVGMKKRHEPLFPPWAFIILILALSQTEVDAKKSIPRSKETYMYSSSPAWNMSSQIDKHGFLANKYKLYPGTWERDARIGGKYGYKSMHTRTLDNFNVVIRQVPGDGNCLFHSLSTALSWVEDRVHLDFDDSFRGTRKCRISQLNRRRSGSPKKLRQEVAEDLDLTTRSSILRQISVDVLNPKTSTSQISRFGRYRRTAKPLFLQGSEFLRPDELLDLACSQYGISGDEYCDSMKNNGVWGGGPEIVALCNYLRRPIHVYELMTIRPSLNNKNKRRTRSNKSEATQLQNSKESWEEATPEFRLRRMALFGSPKFDYREPLHILSADCRFPDLKPGEQASAGNHFMAMFIEKKNSRERIPRVGASRHSHHGVRVRSGGRNASTFAKREVISKYLRADTTRDNCKNMDGILNKMKTIIKGESQIGNNQLSTHDKSFVENPVQAAIKWCTGNHSLVPFRHSGQRN